MGEEFYSMRLTEFFKKNNMNRLDEMVVRYKTDQAYNSLHVVAFKQFIWIFAYNDENMAEVETDMKKITGATDENEYRERPDILLGAFDGTTFHVDISDEMSMHPTISTYIKKVAQYLGADNVEATDTILVGDKEIENTVDLATYEVGKGVPEYAYHGTNTKALPGIMKFGLDPNRGTGNWESGTVGKFSLNFLTVRKTTAMGHAESSARKQKGAPVLLQVKIPDKNNIGPDFDVAMATGLNPELADIVGFSNSQAWHQPHEYQKEQQALILAKSGQNIWKQTGIFSYRGRIPANHIVGIWADLSGELNAQDIYGDAMYEFDDMEEFYAAYELYQDYGYWHPEMEEEIEAMRAEEEDDDFEESVGSSQAGAGDDSSEYEEFVLQWGQPDMPHGNLHY